MTDRERAIVMAYTGVCMLAGDKFSEFHKYVEEICGRPVFTHEMCIIDIKEKSRADFLKLCAGSPIEKPPLGKPKNAIDLHDELIGHDAFID